MADTNTQTEAPKPELSFDQLKSLMKGETVDSPQIVPAETPATDPPAAVEPPKTEETPVEGEETAAAETTETTETTEPPATEKPEKKERRFSKLTKEINEAKQETARLAAENAALKAAQQAPPAQKTEPAAVQGEAAPVPPDTDNFQGTWGELQAAQTKYIQDTVAWQVKQARQADKIAQEQARQVEIAQNVQKTFQAQVDAAIDGEHGETFETAYKEVGAVVSKAGLVDLIKESPVAAEMILAVHGNAALMAKLQDPNVTLARKATELAKVEAAIEAKTAKPPAAAATKKPLPPPPAAVGGTPSSQSAAPVNIDKLPMGQFRQFVHANTTKKK